MSLSTPVILERILNAPADKIWRAISDKTEMKKWYFDIADFKPEEGFEFTFTGQGKDGKNFLHRCRVIEVIKNKKMKYSWRYEGYEGISYVTFELFDEKGKTRLKLTHEGLETFPKTKNNDFAKENFMEGWSYFIGKSLPEYLEKNETGS